MSTDGEVEYDLPAALRIRTQPCRGRGGAALVGRQYQLGDQLVTVVCAYGPCAKVRNVRIQFPDGSTTVRPFRGLRRPPSTPDLRRATVSDRLSTVHPDHPTTTRRTP